MLPYVVLDLETRESFRDVGSFDPAKLTISVVGLYNAATDAEQVFRLEDIGALEGILSHTSRVVGFNLLGFDYHVLQSVFHVDPFTLPTVDLFDRLQRELGFRPKLDDVAAATLGKRKSGNGLEAIRLYQEGNWDALARYCLDDVRLTRDIYEYGLTYGHVKFPSRDGTVREVKAAWVPVPEQARML